MANFLTVRFFAIASLLMVGLVVNVIMMTREYVPIPEVVEEKAAVSRLTQHRYTKERRKTEVKDYGLPGPQQKELLYLINEKEKRYKKSRAIIDQGMKNNGLVRPSVKRAFCRTTKVEPAYGAAALLLEPRDSGLARALTLRNLRSGMSVKYDYLLSNKNLETIFENMELKSYGSRNDMTCVAVALMIIDPQLLLGVDGLTSDDGEVGEPPSCGGLMRKHPGLQKLLVEYFSNVHYLAEVAWKSKNKVCKG